MECRKQLCEKCKKKEDDYFLVTPNFPRAAVRKHLATRDPPSNKTNLLTDIFIQLNLSHRLLSFIINAS